MFGKSCVVPENIHTLLPPRRATEILTGGGGGVQGGGEWPLESFFLVLRVRLMSKLSVILLLIRVSKQKLLFSLMIFHLRSAGCFFHGLHDSLFNTIVVGSWINFRLCICCFFPQYIVVFNVMWLSFNILFSQAYKRSSRFHYNNNVMIMVMIITMTMITVHCPMSRTLFTNIPMFSTLQNDVEMFLKTFQ